MKKFTCFVAIVALFASTMWIQLIVQKRIIWHQSHLSVICVWVLCSGTMTHSFSSEAATKARKGTQEKTRLSRFVLANKPARNTHWQTEQMPRISITLD